MVVDIGYIDFVMVLVDINHDVVEYGDLVIVVVH